MANASSIYDVLPNIRNGNNAIYSVLHIAAGIPADYYMLPTPADVNADVFDRYLKVNASIYAAQFIASGTDAVDARKYGVVLSAVRLGMQKSYGIQAQDLIAAQVTDNAYYTARHAINEDLTNANIAKALPIAAVRTQYTLIDAANDLLDPTVIANLLRFGVAIPAVTGVILVKTDGLHHYVDPHKGVFRAVMRQILGSFDNIPFDLDKDVFEDLVAHKASHPIRSDVLIAFARDEKTKLRLMASGLAAAAVRIPALYACESALGAVDSLVRKVVAISQAANVNIDMAHFDDARKKVFENLVLDNAHDRGKATVAATQFTSDHGTDIGRCMGILNATCENAQIALPPLSRSFALKRVIAENPAAVSEGYTQMTNYFKTRRAQANRGIVGGMGLFGANIPESTPPLPADETLAQILNAVMGANAGPAAGPAPVK